MLYYLLHKISPLPYILLRHTQRLHTKYTSTAVNLTRRYNPHAIDIALLLFQCDNIIIKIHKFLYAHLYLQPHQIAKMFICIPTIYFSASHTVLIHTIPKSYFHTHAYIYYRYMVQKYI